MLLFTEFNSNSWSPHSVDTPKSQKEAKPTSDKNLDIIGVFVNLSHLGVNKLISGPQQHGLMFGRDVWGWICSRTVLSTQTGSTYSRSGATYSRRLKINLHFIWFATLTSRWPVLIRTHVPRPILSAQQSDHFQIHIFEFQAKSGHYI